jgi:hypothetical protein
MSYQRIRELRPSLEPITTSDRHRGSSDERIAYFVHVTRPASGLPVAQRSSSYDALPVAAAVIRIMRMGCYAGIMTVTLHLDDAIAEALVAEAARRGQTADQLASQLPKAPRRRLAFAAVGASTSGRGAAEADEMLAEGFGRD